MATGNIAQIIPGGFNPSDYPAQVFSFPTDPKENIRKKAADLGIILPSLLIVDGRIHRFATSEKRGDDAGWYVFHQHDNFIAGTIGDHRGAEFSHNIHSAMKDLSAREKRELAKAIEAGRLAQEEERKKKIADGVEFFGQQWPILGPANVDHGYIKAKGMKDAYGLKIDGSGRLVIPRLNDKGEIQNVQRIAAAPSATGRWEKKNDRFPVAGTYYVIGSTANAEKVYVAEGIATAATIYEETGAPCYVSFSCNNMPAVAKIAQAQNKGKRLIIAADKGEAGEKWGKKAATETGADLIVSPGNAGADFNDYRAAGGDVAEVLGKGAKSRFEDYLITADQLKAKFKSTLSQGWTIKNILPESAGLSVIYGDPGSYKSFITLDMTLSMACCLDWHGHKVKGKNILYMAGEGQEGLLKRIEVWRMKRKQEEIKNFTLLPLSCLLDDEEDAMEFLFLLRRMETPDIIVVDTLSRSMSGEENSKVDMGKVVKMLDRIREELGCSAIVVHHSGKEKDKGLRGSNSLEAATHVIFKTEKNDEDMSVVLKCERQKDDAIPGDLAFDMEVIDTGEVNADGDSVNSLVPVLKEKTKAKPLVKGEDIKNLVDAFASLSKVDTWDSRPYITRAAWARYLHQVGVYKTEASARQAVKEKAKSGIAPALIKGGIIASAREGYRVINDDVCSQIMAICSK